jgi:hypothetical protein
MKLKKTAAPIFLVLVIHTLCVGLTQAQTESQFRINEKDSTKIKSTDLLKAFEPTANLNLNLTNPFNIAFPDFKNQAPLFQFQQPVSKSAFSFNQKYTEINMSGLGTSQWFNNQFLLKAGERITFGLEGGFAIQNTVLNPWVPNYQYTLGVSVDFAITDNLNAYVFGRYISDPLNKPKDYFDPFMYNNSQFLQSGTGAGIKTNMKNRLIDFQIMSGYDHQLKMMNNFNSKLRIEF